MRRILVMGGASLLGSHLCERLLEDGHEVIAVDDFTTGSFATLAHLSGEDRFAFVEHDVTAKFQAHVDAIFHLAVPSSRRACESDPVRATVTSVMGTLHALEVAEQHGARVVLGTSPERFGQGVRCAESLAIDFVRTRSVDVRIVRIASAYGPRMPLDDPHIVTRLARAALSGEDLVLGVPPETIERLAYVTDAVDTLVRTMSSDLRVPAVAAPFVETTASAIGRAVLDATGGMGTIAGESHLAPAAPPPSPRMTTPDALAASIVFGQSARVDLEDGIARTVAWMEERIGNRASPRTSGIYGRRRPVEKVG